MSQARGRFEIDRNRIILEQFEDEAVLVNIESGYYYSLSTTGSEILHLLEDGCTADDVVPILFGNSEHLNGFRTGIDEFIEQLRAEGILVARNADRPILDGNHGTPARYKPGTNYEPPILERFDDVRDLLLIDPVHQVDREYGWPKKIDAGSPMEPRA